MDRDIYIGAGTTKTATGAGDQLIEEFATIVNDPNLTTIPGGNWNFEQYVSMSANGGTPSLFVNIYTRDTGGTGLGLAIVKHVALRHQAELRIESQIGQGSTFEIIFVKDRLVDGALNLSE